jgi:hypothetical protein
MELREGQVQILAKIEGLGVRMAVHEAKPIHDGAARRLGEVECALDNQQSFVNKSLGALAVLVFLVPIAITIALKVL